MKDILTIIGGVSLHLFLGSMYCWGNLQLYIASYYHMYDSSVRENDTFMGLTYIMTAQALVQWSSPILLRKFNHRLILLIALILGLGGIFLSSYTKSITLFMFVFSIPYGMCVGLIYMIPVQCAWEFRPEWKGYITGIIISAYGLSAFIFNFVIKMIINPDNINPIKIDGQKFYSPDIAKNFPSLIRYLVLIYTILGVIGLFLTFRKPKSEDEVMNDVKTENDKLKCIAKSPYFVCSYIMNMLTILTGYFIVNIYQNQGVDQNYGLDEMQYIGEIGSLLNCASRIIISIFVSKVSYKWGYIVMMLTQVLSLIILLLVQNEYVYIIFNISVFFSYGGHFTLTASYYSKIYGPKVGSEMYGFFFTSFVFSNLLNFATKALYSDTSYTVVLLSLIGCNVVAFMILMGVYKFKDEEYVYEGDKEGTDGGEKLIE